MNKRIENFIPIALEAIDSLGISKNGSVAKEYNGYIASFGASVRQAGLLATILFYDNANSNAQEDRSKVIRALEKITGEKLDKNTKNSPQLRAKVEDAAIALKLSLRTYKLVKES